ncbi:MAG: hypothetical protein IPK50_06835 [Fibrobacterota bacterium]|nr:hypothetical protein [Fibrobacterota bacterium]QQS06608.1 MAG: hypothetical protein IPK50_06835 [Fibrobacterota bacterium]
MNGPVGMQVKSEDFWGNPGKIEDVGRACFDSRKPCRLLLAPEWVDREDRKTIPVWMVQCGSLREFHRGSLKSDALLALVDLDRNSLQLSGADAEPAVSVQPFGGPPKPVEEADIPDDSFHESSTQVDLRPKFFPDLAHTTGRFKLVALLAVASTLASDLQVGSDASSFAKALAASLATLKPRTVVPSEFVAETAAWKALAAPPGLPKGVRAEVAWKNNRALLVLDFALPELPGERIELEPGAVLPNGARPPGFAKNIHLVLMGKAANATKTLLLPVGERSADGLLRGKFEVDLLSVQPNLVDWKFQSVYALSGEALVGPVAIPARP